MEHPRKFTCNQCGSDEEEGMVTLKGVNLRANDPKVDIRVELCAGCTIDLLAAEKSQ